MIGSLYVFIYLLIVAYLFTYLYIFIYSRVETLTNSDHVTCNCTVPMSAGRSFVRPRIPEDNLFRDRYFENRRVAVSANLLCVLLNL